MRPSTKHVWIQNSWPVPELTYESCAVCGTEVFGWAKDVGDDKKRHVSGSRPFGTPQLLAPPTCQETMDLLESDARRDNGAGI